MQLLRAVSKKDKKELSQLIEIIVTTKNRFSIDELAACCLHGAENPVKKLFLLSKQIPQLKSALPDLNEKDSQGNTLLLILLTRLHQLMQNYANYINSMTEDPECTSVIPFLFANQLKKMQKLCRSIQYLLLHHADETIKNKAGISSTYLFNKINTLSKSHTTQKKKHFVPLINMFADIDAERHDTTFCGLLNTFFCRPVWVTEKTLHEAPGINEKKTKNRIYY